MASGFLEAIDALHEQQASSSLPESDGTWRRLVEVLLGLASRAACRGASAELPPPLATPGQTATAHLEEIEQAAGRSARGGSRLRALKSLAAWWSETFGDDLAPGWEGSAERWRESLSPVRGVSLELVDRILLFVAGKPAWPVDRATQRIACRHGWMDPQAEYEEWQSRFTRGGLGDIRELKSLSESFDQVGRDHCGPRPRCDGCPLQPFLPAGGPYEIEA